MINQSLRELYFSFETEVKAISNKYLNIDGPLLMHCWDEDYNTAAFKILFIGQEHTWMFKHINDDIQKSLEWYEGFSLGKTHKYPFWKTVREFNEILNPHLKDSNNFLATNVAKYSANGKTIPLEDHKSIVGLMNLLPMEIEILNPNIIIFLSGPDFDERIKIQFEEDLNFIQVDKSIPTRELAQIESLSKHPILPKHTYRTYHPNALQWQKKKHYLNIITDKILEHDSNKV